MPSLFVQNQYDFTCLLLLCILPTSVLGGVRGTEWRDYQVSKKKYSSFTDNVYGRRAKSQRSVRVGLAGIRH